MRTVIKTLVCISVIVSLVSCKKTSVLNIDSICINAEEYLGIGEKPVCLKFNISTIEKYNKTYHLEQVVSINDNNITISIQTMDDMGECEYPANMSAPEPENYQCTASTGYFTLENLSRKSYNIEIFVFDAYFQGEIDIQDQSAIISLNDNNVSLLNSELTIVPDSCFYGTYYSYSYDSIGFNEMIDGLLLLGCECIQLKPGLYRSFEVDDNGFLNINPGEVDPNPTFILKYNKDFNVIYAALDDFVANSGETSGIIFRDHLRNYYNIKK